MVYGSSASSRCAAGPKIAAIGGGTGLSTLLRGLKRYTKNITAIVTVADDGSASRQLRISPGGSIPRSCRSRPEPPPSSATVTMAVIFFV